MVSELRRPSLMAHLSKEPIERITQQDLLGGRYVRFLPFLFTGMELYLTGAVLARVLWGNLETLAQMWSQPEEVSDAMRRLTDRASRRIYKYGGTMPQSFFDFFMKTELEKAGLTLTDFEGLKREANGKIPLDQATPIAESYVAEGIGFGSRFPAYTATMWKQTYESPDLTWWAEARKHGVDVPAEPAPAPLEQREQQVREEVASYVREYFPHLLEPLGLHSQ